MLSLGQPQERTLLAGSPLVWRYVASTPQTVHIKAQALGDDSNGYPLDLVIEVLDAQTLARVAYNDDRDADTRDPALTELTLAAGAYLIRVNAFNGYQEGRVSVSIE